MLFDINIQGELAGMLLLPQHFIALLLALLKGG